MGTSSSRSVSPRVFDRDHQLRRNHERSKMGRNDFAASSDMPRHSTDDGGTSTRLRWAVRRVVNAKRSPARESRAGGTSDNTRDNTSGTRCAVVG